MERSNRTGLPLSVLMIDVDHFKIYNDRHGHLAGDNALRGVSKILEHVRRANDVVARYGGEEFAIILPGTSLRAALTVADHVRRAVMTKELMKRSTGEHLGRVTVSIGVAVLQKGETAQSLIERADNCLYTAKRCGRNRVMCETDPEVSAVAVKVA